MIKNLKSISYKLFGSYFENEKKIKKYLNLKSKLQKARIDTPLEVWLSFAMFISVILWVLIFFTTVFILWISGVFSFPSIINEGIPTLIDIITNFEYYTFGSLTKHISTVFLTLIVFIGPILIAFVTFKLFNIYPSIKASGRSRKINASLPYAINYISAMAGAGVPPVDIFRMLAASETYGEVSREAKEIVRDTELFGKDIITSMRRVSRTTPSKKFQEFIQGAITTITSGGNLEVYFKNRAEQYMTENRQSQEEFLETLSLVGETYVTAFVAGPLFMIVMIVVMAMMGGIDILLLYLVVYVIIPVGTILFLILIDTITPEV
ncbi:MAG: secretion system protein [Methanonatronarchaeia archaeon]|nr:MAG: secretion system protein [Methanonatronarchaeia archaeon]